MIQKQLQAQNLQRLVAKKIIFTMVCFADLGMGNNGCQVPINLEILENFRDNQLLGIPSRQAPVSALVTAEIYDFTDGHRPVAWLSAETQ